MGESSGISWTDHTFSPWWGCTRCSAGCANCFAERWAKRWGFGWGSGGNRRFFGDAHWREPVRWNARAARAGIPEFVFCTSMGDIFENVPFHVREQTADARTRLWLLIEETPWLVWLLLTKRPENVHYLAPRAWWTGAWPDNVWLGTSVENQANFDSRVPLLLRAPAPRHIVSYEPALGPIDWGLHRDPNDCPKFFDKCRCGADWVIVGGESGDKARPFDLAWARSTVAQCRAAGVPCWVKQLGSRPYDLDGDSLCADGLPPVGSYLDLGNRAGADSSEWPEDLCVQQRPTALLAGGRA